MLDGSRKLPYVNTNVTPFPAAGIQSELQPIPPRSLSNNSFLETKNATQYPAYSNLDFVVELLTSLHSLNYVYRLEYCLSDRLLAYLRARLTNSLPFTMPL